MGCYDCLRAFKPKRAGPKVHREKKKPEEGPTSSATALPPSSEVDLQTETCQTVHSTILQPTSDIQSNDKDTSTSIDESISPLPPLKSEASENDPVRQYPDDTASEDLWQSSFNNLSREEQDLLRDLLDGKPAAIASDTETTSPFSFSNTNAQEIIEITRERQKQWESRTYQINIHGHKIVPREYTGRIIDCLTTVGDIGVQFLPQPASVVWPLVKGVMQVPVNAEAETAAAIMTADMLIRVITCGKVYEESYRGKLESELWVLLHPALVNLYVAALQLVAFALKRFSQHAASQLVRALLNPQAGQSQVSGLRTRQTELLEVVNSCQNKVASRMSDDILNLLEKIRDHDSFVVSSFNDLFERLDERRVTEILDWISPTKEFDRHNTKKTRAANTCDWILQDEAFQAWEDSVSPGVIWLQGSIGTGKTFLTARIIEHILENGRADEGLAFYYCQHSGQRYENPDDVIRSLLRQLATPAKDDTTKVKIRKDVQDLFAKMNNKASHPDIQTCKDYLLQSLGHYRRITIVLDALDECDEGLRHQLFDVIDSLVDESQCMARVFVSARPEPDIKDRFGQYLTIRTNSPKVQRDIGEFIDQKIEVLKTTHWTRISKKVQKEAIETLTERSEGM
ncbi:hypothetical protein BP00DRAFT_474501 [Aspergillus indologenus CBS 114.80]|uniref:Nephrocystin 3-like N-terminal domain-containing protein n=1 Tax=Aspergillus indologenus CBS 114.80 TaxID=1450541 RepID=A0A2V5I483_9EURO|nr:hypothetical protein BP00DRAFT_474501 [Aspergillus indologenus CBS 114.80]